MAIPVNEGIRVMNLEQDIDEVSREVVPASWDLYEMIQAFLQAPSYHVYFEILLIAWIARLVLFTKSYKPSRTVLTEKEKEELIDEWQPEALVPDVDEDHPLLQNINNRLIHGKIGKYVKINDKECLNMASMNFLSMSARKDIEESAVKSLRKYGVGSCGPRGFYGTVDVHLKLEEKLEKFMRCEEAIIYSYGFATIASAIPAYSKRGDIIFADEGVHFAIQKGIQASRSKAVFFKHNDLADLERLLQIQQEEDRRNPKKAKVTRRFMVIEGLYLNYGDLCPLPQLIELRNKYKVRIFLDETVSFGTLGATGRGVTEHYNVDMNEIDLMAGSLEYALASVGGFCCGKAYVIDHQRLSGLGYCFSASCPPMLAQSAITALEILEDKPEMLEKLRKICQHAHEELNKLEGVRIGGSDISPILHMYISKSISREQDSILLRKIVQMAEEKNLALTMAAYLDEEIFMPQPSIRIPISVEMDYGDIDEAVNILKPILKALL
ncbi:hypothetical protein HELRODRAFT_108446 [Helobdella robusta]|uniref:Serine palmitoyltransferase 1 n=1 Tax=Helobdella robusta TaxID=6412 RepID=T1EEI9_HELRO|nr:hypothetical protein HELRODRAFT_108446 [Helobdella robusta]ESN91666.1 hypothetical protein HELRODRAFT_108446 [Helobdella robusta]